MRTVTVGTDFPLGAAWATAHTARKPVATANILMRFPRQVLVPRKCHTQAHSPEHQRHIYTSPSRTPGHRHSAGRAPGPTPNSFTISARCKQPWKNDATCSKSARIRSKYAVADCRDASRNNNPDSRICQYHHNSDVRGSCWEEQSQQTSLHGASGLDPPRTGQIYLLARW